jgi:hypothetical protein
MTFALSILPSFRLQSAKLEGSAVLLTGLLEASERVVDGPRWLWLWTSPEIAVTATIRALDPSSGTAVLETIRDELSSVPSVGTAFRWLHSYWQAYHVPMILRGEWRSSEFQPVDAVTWEIEGARGWSKLSEPIPDGATRTGVREHGWDHEHCEICSATIGIGGESSGYVDSEDRWLCPRCHERWAERRDLGFLVS